MEQALTSNSNDEIMPIVLAQFFSNLETRHKWHLVVQEDDRELALIEHWRTNCLLKNRYRVRLEAGRRHRPFDMDAQYLLQSHFSVLRCRYLAAETR